MRSNRLRNKRLLVGITGSVAAYKAVDLVRRLRDSEASVSTIMTDASCRFITPLSVELAAGSKPLLGMFDDPMSHVELSAESDLMLVAPATANTIARMANGLADDLLSASYLAFRGPVVIAPAMNTRMYESPAFRRNLAYLKELGVTEVPPAEGMLACGERGRGRMAEVDLILQYVSAALSSAQGDLAGKKVIVTAGPTREYLDPVRYISNRSSGRMGYAMARAAQRRGADVVLISGPSALEPPAGVELLNVQSAAQMREAVMDGIASGAYMLVMAAAVADFAPVRSAGAKIPKEDLPRIDLRANPDILAEASTSAHRPDIVLGFAAETGESIERAEGKLRSKGADYIVFNNVLAPDAGFDVETNKVTLIGRDGGQSLPLMSKDEVADKVLDIVLKA